MLLYILKSIPPEIYCQSRQIESIPRPSFPLVPPKIRVKVWERGSARQKIEKPVRSGKIHSGNNSQIKILWCGKRVQREDGP